MTDQRVTTDATSTKQVLIDAATDHVRTTGLDGLTLRSIARAVGVSHAAPARHFDGVATLLAAVAARSFESLTITIEERLATADEDPLRRLAAAGEAYVAFALAHPNEYELMFRPERLDQDAPDYATAAAAFAVIADLVTDAHRAGWRTEADAMTMTAVVWAGVHGVASLWVQGALSVATNTSDPAPVVAAMISRLTSSPISPPIPPHG